MTTESLSLQVRSVVSDVMGVPVASINAASSPENIEAWDSVQHLSLVMSLEQALAIQFQPEEIEKLRTVGAIETLIMAKRQGA